MNPKFYVIPGWKVGSRMTATRFLPAKRGPRHQAANGYQGGDTAAIVTKRGIPIIERLDGRPQQGLLSP